MPSFSQCDILQKCAYYHNYNSLYNNVQHILNIYIQYCLQLHYPVNCMCFLHMLIMWYFSQWLFFYNPSFSQLHNYRTIHSNSTTMSTAYPQHIHTYCLQLHNPMYTVFCNFTYALQHFNYNVIFFHNPVNCMCFLHMLPFHNVIFFHNHCTIHSTKMSIAYPQHIHTVLFTITQPIYCMCFYICFLFTMWYFFTITAQLALHQCLQHIRNIYI